MFGLPCSIDIVHIQRNNGILKWMSMTESCLFSLCQWALLWEGHRKKPHILIIWTELEPGYGYCEKEVYRNISTMTTFLSLLYLLFNKLNHSYSTSLYSAVLLYPNTRESWGEEAIYRQAVLVLLIMHTLYFIIIIIFQHTLRQKKTRLSLIWYYVVIPLSVCRPTCTLKNVQCSKEWAPGGSASQQ